MYTSQDFDAVTDKKCFRSLSLKLENEFIIFKSAGKLLNWYVPLSRNVRLPS